MTTTLNKSDEWSDWGFSNSVLISLEKGRNEFRICFDDWNTNMDGEINLAMLDYLRLVMFTGRQGF